MSDKPASGLWRNNPDTSECKYLVKRRDGSVVEWPSFVLGAKDPAAVAALLAYAREASFRGYNTQYVDDIYELARQFQKYREEHGDGDPDRGPHRQDDPSNYC